MKAVKIKKNGGPGVLDIEEITLRKPIKGEVLIEHAAIGLNYIDTYHRSGLYPLKLPIGIGLEGAGIITDIGEVKEFCDPRIQLIKQNIEEIFNVDVSEHSLVLYATSKKNK